MGTNVRLYLSYDINVTLKSHFWRETLGFCHINAPLSWTSFNNATKICKPQVVIDLIYGLFHSQTRRHIMIHCIKYEIYMRAVNNTVKYINATPVISATVQSNRRFCCC